MIFPFLKFHHKKFKIHHLNKGMTYVELIVVLSIFAVISTIVLFNYKNFQARVDVKNLANDIALKLIDAQKLATSGKLPTNPPVGWKPSYGLYFNLTPNPPNTGNKIFYFFVDLNQDTYYDEFYSLCPPSAGSGECLDRIDITKGNYISGITAYYQNIPPGPPPLPTAVDDALHITFTRPSSGATIIAQSITSPLDYIEITVTSSVSPSVTSSIKVYPSGRIQLN